MGARHGGTTWSEVERLVNEYVERGMLDEETRAEVEELLRRGEASTALALAHEHNRPSGRDE